jgi:hypothetical protein
MQNVLQTAIVLKSQETATVMESAMRDPKYAMMSGILSVGVMIKHTIMNARLQLLV